ncbi:hypothetical protein F4827_003102 [Paraburkholderia bannensis]|uniref:Peptidase S74 domain-containing protein n=1 Tax=Paraburkholderia bannensis TaxID=765414 RepID=A0A7W9TXI4_9BURK|nr:MULTISPECIES: tail fiber domain-containing protein [Paraburkholderia]MBB3258234.1 hypothetical protein [Paraburkholderia sp. WP4_3_2]MBB6103247.1 hypothetical protein [Paraburkholderia bannensis]
MRRVETYVGQQVYEWLFSAQAQNNMTAVAKVCAALFGTGGTVNGLPCTPTSPATMTVQIGAGEIYQMENLEATACGTLPANTAYQILKQGIQLGTYTTPALAAPTTSGQSINYLIEAQYQDSDISLDPTSGTSPVVLQFYNAANPSTPWSGPNNSGATSNTFRDGVVAYQIKAGVAATTGSQTTPSPDTGWVGLWVVTVPYGATSLTSSNISQYTGSPILPSGILQSIVTSNLTYGVDSGTANTIQAKFPIPVTTLIDGMDVWVKVAAANTGATTFTPNPGVIAAAPVVGAAHQALQGGETVAGGRANLIYRADITSWVLVECTGAAVQVAPGTQSQHAVQYGQMTSALTSYAPKASPTVTNLTVSSGGIAVSAGGINVQGGLVINGGSLTLANSAVFAGLINMSGTLTVAGACGLDTSGAGSTFGGALSVGGAVNSTGSVSHSASTFGYLNNTGAGNSTTTSSLGCGFYTTSGSMAGQFWTTSDIRIKTQIEGLNEADAEKFVRTVEPKTYLKRGAPETGFIAQDVGKAVDGRFVQLLTSHDVDDLAEMVDDDGFVSPANAELHVNYQQIIPIHAAVLRKLLREFDCMKMEIAALKEGR